MPLRESEAIVLRTYPLGEGDRLVSFLSRSEGRIRGVAAGARKPKSRFGASLEPLSHIRIWFYERETRELVRISQCELIEAFVDAQREYNGVVAFSLVAEVVEGILPEREASDAVFRLILAVCRAMGSSGQVGLPIAYFAFWMLRLGGWLPSFERCAGCHRALSGEEVWGSVDGSGVWCRGCRAAGTTAIGADAIPVAGSMLRESLENLVQRETARVPAGLTNYLLDLIEAHMEKRSGIRPMLELTS